MRIPEKRKQRTTNSSEVKKFDEKVEYSAEKKAE